MEQDWTCPHCGQKIGTLNIVPSAAANPQTFQQFIPPTSAANMPTVIPVTITK